MTIQISVRRRAVPVFVIGMLGLAMLAGVRALGFVMPAGIMQRSPRFIIMEKSSGFSGNTAGFSSTTGTVSSTGLLGATGALAAVVVGAAALRRAGAALRCKAEDSEWVGAEQISARTAGVPQACDNIEIAQILPHRYPFLLVDKVIYLEKMKRAVGVKNVTANEPQFTGHFPDMPIMPGVLMVEALAQLAGVVCMNPGDQVLFAGIDGVKFKRKVVPGDTLVMEVEVLKFRSGIAKMSGKGYVDGQLAIVVKEFTCALIKADA